MTLKVNCPWCEESFTSRKVPRSAAARHSMDKVKNHISEHHQDKEKEYKEILNIWDEKIYENKNFIEVYLDLFNHLIGNIKGQSSPDREIVEEYSVEELKNMSEEELREVVEKY